MIFPRVLSGPAATAQDVFQQLRGFERLDRARQQEIVERQLLELMRHAQANSSFWRARLDTAGFDPAAADPSCFRSLPVLKRSDLQNSLPLLRARGPKMTDDSIVTHASSGSTGQPVQVEKFRPVYAPLFAAAALLEHERHGRDARKSIGSYVLKGEDRDDLDWGAPLNWFGATGPMYQRRLVERPVEELYDALRAHRPAYVKANPTAIRALAQAARERPETGPAVEQFLSWAGPVTAELRSAVKQVFGATIADCYSCEEVGYIAQQCAQHAHLHVLAPLTLVEIVDDQGLPCPVGVHGRVLLTSLHSFAMPILRYEVGDLAQWGPDCDCGIRTPVIDRVLGRTRDLVSLPNGSKRFVSFSDDQFAAIAPIREYKVILHLDGVIEFLVCARRQLNDSEKSGLVACLQKRFDYPYPVAIREVDSIARNGLWKNRDFEQSGRHYNHENSGLWHSGRRPS